MRRKTMRMAVAAVVAAVLAVPGAASGQDLLLNWGQVLPGFTPGLDTSSSNICTAGRAQCVESALRTMSRDFHRLARDCDHDAMFQLGYLRTTEAYYESSQIPGFYDDVPWMHHYDAVFAEYYLGPQRAWAQGRTGEVPPAWQVAFAAADGRELTATGSFLMGMNAHINRDLPFVLDDIGLTDEDGDSRKPDHEKVNEFLANVGDDLTPEFAARFDPSYADQDPVTGLVIQQVIQEWRERAWNNAWLMTYTPEPVADLVAQGIEAGSAQLAELVRQAMAADDAARDARDAYCAANWDSWEGGDGTYFDGQDEPATTAAVMALPAAAQTLDALAALGVGVDVSLERGVEITLVDDLLEGLPLVGEIPLVEGVLDTTTDVVDQTVTGTTEVLTTTTGGLLGLFRR